MITIKEYAKNVHVSYEAVRKQVKRYEADLEGHIVQEGRTQYLDDVAVEFLDDKRRKNPVVVYEAAKDEEIARLKEENQALLLKVADLQEQLIAQLQENKQLQADKIALLEVAAVAQPEEVVKAPEEDFQPDQSGQEQPDITEQVVPKRWWQFWK